MIHLYILYQPKMANHDVHIPKAFTNYLIYIWLMDAIDLLSNFGPFSLAECYMGFPKFPGIQEVRMDSTYFLKEQLLRAEFCSVDLQRGKCTREDNREEQNELQDRNV